MARGETLGIVGESGCGKSVTALSILRLIPPETGRIAQGSIRFEDTVLTALSEVEMNHLRGQRSSMIFQEPMTSLNPVYTIGEQILEAILLHQRVDRRQAVQIAEEALRDVGIADPGGRLKDMVDISVVVPSGRITVYSEGSGIKSEES